MKILTRIAAFFAKLKLKLKGKHMDVQPKTIKPGYLSTEFWIAIGGNVAAILGTVSQTVDPKVGATMLIASNLIYSVVRAFAKR